MGLLFLGCWAIIGKRDGILYGLNGYKVRELYTCNRVASLRSRDSKV